MAHLKYDKKLLLRLAVLAIGVYATIVLPPWRLTFLQITPLPDSLGEQVKSITEYGFDSAIVYIQQGDDVAEFYTAGQQERRSTTAVKPGALFKIASIGKLYDVVAVTKLAADGRLSLDKTLAEYLPELAASIANAESITLRMMVQHRSGIPNFTNAAGFWGGPSTTTAEALALIAGLPATFEPNQGYEYSNTNYLLIAEIIKAATGLDKRQIISDEILLPLNLSNTFFHLADIDVNALVSGYHVNTPGDMKTVNYGSMIATAQDLGKFIRALNTGQILDSKEDEIYTTLYPRSHTGLIPGYQSIARYHAESDSVIVIFVNTTDFADYQHWAIFEALYSRILTLHTQRIDT
ncbi:serine hydrolase domain-containing protein [Alteromonas sp. ASW11-36]|uniref:Serine hydrolase domain-containing protein n=1 Tax=Alteromonas arenosi TaxID=3055817 RepID=A0ABT7T0M1_9ALTE|nr:serine hydrolase domain-containing protein [Alteromonas sp. ASW11-36]MDM7861987.1 serine hydrolase domain-containing protein [Alteromonas sp. ASW11-36]